MESDGVRARRDFRGKRVRDLNMKREILTAFSIIALSSMGQADEIERAFKHLSGASMYMANDFFLKTGWYSLDGVGGKDAKVDNTNFVGSYYFGKRGDRYRPFVIGGVGVTDIKQNEINLHRSSSTIDKAEFDAIYTKIGAGVNYNPTQKLGLIIGGSVMLYRSESGNYETKAKLNPRDRKDKKIKELFCDENNNRLYDIFGGAIYHSSISGYKSYLKGTLHYLSFDFDKGVSSSDGLDLDLKAGIHTDSLAMLYHTPVWMEFFLASNLLNSNLSDLVGFKKALTFGSSLHWLIGPYMPKFTKNAFENLDLSWNIQGTIGDEDFSGWKSSLSLNIVKF